MNSMTMGLMVFAGVFGGTLFGLYLSKRVAAHHLSADSKDVMKIALGVIGTLAALVLGLLLASAKSSFDAKGPPFGVPMARERQSSISVLSAQFEPAPRMYFRQPQPEPSVVNSPKPPRLGGSLRRCVNEEQAV